MNCPAGVGQAACRKRPPAPERFVAPACALALLIRVVNRGYKARWQPRVTNKAGEVLRLVGWIGVVLGWIASLLPVGVLADPIKKD